MRFKLNIEEKFLIYEIRFLIILFLILSPIIILDLLERFFKIFSEKIVKIKGKINYGI